jgi:CubicO group peptidase (beta-lactamase class C family)
MSTLGKLIVSVVVVLFLVGACGQGEPTATPVPPTATTIAIALTDTPVPPTATPTATAVPPTNTPIPPTAEPSPTVTPTTEPSPTAAPVTEPGVTSNTWIKTYGGDQDDVGWDVLLADDGGYFIVGTTNLEFEPEQQGDIYLIRTDAAGEVLWEKTYGGEEYDAGSTIFPADDGGLMIAGHTASFGAGGQDAYLIKVDQDGNEIWSKTFGGPLDEMATAWPMEDGGYVVGGIIVDPNDIVADPGAAGYGGLAGRSNIYLSRTDDDGNELWTRTFGGENNVMATSGVQTPDGGFLILATILRYPENDDDIYLLKVDENGEEVWSRTWDEGTTNSYDLVQTPDGNYLISGSYSPYEDMDRVKLDFLFIKVDPEGNELWTSTFGDPDMVDHGSVLAETTDGGYVTAGELVKDYYSWDADIMLVKIDENGQPLWERIFETDAHSMFATILQHPDGGYVVAGSTFNGRVFDIFLIKTDSEGNTSALPTTSQTVTSIPPTATLTPALPAPQEAPAPPPPFVADIIAYIEDLASQDQFSGAVLIAQGDEPIFKGAYGPANRSFDVSNEVDTKFNLGSMDKMFTAVAILQLVEQGKLSLDDKVVDILPDYANSQVANQVTVHQLLTHMSGMGNYFDSELYKDIHDQIRSVADYLPLFINTPLRFEPGAQFGYSNSGYIVLGLIIEKVTGRSYYDYVRESIFEPGGMINTAAYELDAGVPNLAIGYTKLDAEGNETDKLTDNLFVMPMRGGSAGGGFSTAEDLLRFGNALLDHQLLSPASTELLLEGKVELGENVQYAYGFFDRMLENQRIVGHGGGFPGICSSMGMYLDTGYTLIVLSNTDRDCLPVLEFIQERLLDH